MYILQGDNLSQKILASALKKNNISFFWGIEEKSDPPEEKAYSRLDGALAISPSNWDFLCSIKPALSSVQVQVECMQLHASSVFFPLKSKYRASLFFDHQKKTMCYICPLQTLHDLFQKENSESFVRADSSKALSIQSSQVYHTNRQGITLLGSARQCLLLLKGAFDNRTAYQFFLWPHIFGLLPMGNGRFCCTWSQSEPATVCATQLRFLLDPLLSEMGISIEQVEKISDPILIRSSHASRYVSEPQTLKIGEAAHLIHPLAGQGLNLTLYDIRAVLDGMASGLILDLGPYIEKKRYAHNHFLVHFCEKMAKKEAAWWLPSSLAIAERAPSWFRAQCLLFMQ